MFNRTKIEEFSTDITTMIMPHALFRGSSIKRFKCELPLNTDMKEMFYNCPLESFECSSSFEKVNHTQNAFYGCQLNKTSILSILSKKFKQKTLTIGIHVDNQEDEDVLTAISNAEANGMVMTVQWNGVPSSKESSTYGLRKPSIFAKVTEEDDGKHILDWGHYVTNPEDYQEFSSLEEARNYFNLPKETEENI